MKNKMRRMLISLFITVSLINIGCSNSKVKFDWSNISKIYVENRAMHRYGGIKQAIITDKVEIAYFCERISSFKNESNKITMPFNGSVQIEFVYLDKTNNEAIISKYSTAIIFKEDESYFITNTNGQFTDEVFLNNIKSLLQFKK